MRAGEDALGDGGARLDVRLLLPALVSWAVTVWVLGQPVSSRWWVAGALAVISAGWMAVLARGGGLDRSRRSALGCLCALAAAATSTAAAADGVRAAAGGVDELAAARATIAARAVVLTEPVVRARPGREATITLRVRLTSVTARGAQRITAAPVLVQTSEPGWAQVRWHDEVSLRGRLAASDPGEPVLAVLRPRGPPESGSRGQLLELAEGLRSRLRDASAGLPADARGLVPALVIGDTSQTPPDLHDDMLVTGMSHLSAVSGSNVAIVLGACLLLTRLCAVPRRLRPWVAAAGLTWFVMLARPEPSVLRAAVMGSVGLLGMSASRRGAGAPALAAAVVSLLLVDPWLARSYGFALSTLATLGLLVFAGPWSAAINAHLPRHLHVIGPACAIPLAAHLACAPVVVLLQGSVSTISVLANLVAAPFVAPTTIAGIVVALVAVPLPAAAGWLAWAAGVPALAIAGTARVAADVPGGSIDWPDGSAGAWLLAGLTLAGLLCWPWLTHRARAAPAMALAVLVAVTTTLLPSRVLTGPPKEWVMVMCDVGQGDALVLRSGPGRAVLVDAGPEPAAVDRCLDRLDVQTLDAVVLSHLDADHADGLAGALEGRAVGEIVLSPVAEPAWSATRVRRLAAEHEVPVSTVVAGDELHYGEMRAEVWWPARRIAQGSVPNNASVVLRAQVGELSALLLGDVEAEAAHAMLLRLRRDPAMSASLDGLDVLKVAHHGSGNTDVAFLEQVRAPVALISVGADNDSGHPAPALLSTLQRQGRQVWRTDEDATVLVGEDDSGPAVARLR